MNKKISLGKFKNAEELKELIGLGEFLKSHGISFVKAQQIISRAQGIEGVKTERTHWKMMRFAFYIWERAEHLKKISKNNTVKYPKLEPRVETVRRVVALPEYKRAYFGFFEAKSFNFDDEVHNLTQLIAEPRQKECFKEGNFVYKRPELEQNLKFASLSPKDAAEKYWKSSKVIPQHLLDYIR